ncbi:MAG: isocitrate/isopropylmalate dehydrogenase family protein [Bulleidia sp.]
MKAVLIPGDGIGKEISESAKKVSEALNTGIEWEEYKAGAEYFEQTGSLIEPGLIDAIERDGIALKGPTATPIGKGFRSINVQLRQRFSTYANLRPVHSRIGVKSRYENVDLVVIRENSEDLYMGLEYMIGTDTAHGIKLITRQASERIARFAFEYARAHGRHLVTCVHKANIMKYTDGLFLEAFNHVAESYPEIAHNSVIVDAMTMKLVIDPTQFDVIVAPNLYGDILSDLCSGLAGGLGFAPSANIGDHQVIYEAVHGSAPDIAGKDLANPSALLLAMGMLLRDHGMSEKADALEHAVDEVIRRGEHTTRDIGGNAGTREFTDAVIAELEETR